MAKTSSLKIDAFNQIDDLSIAMEDLQKIECEVNVLLMLPPKLYETYHKQLEKKAHEYKINMVISMPGKISAAAIVTYKYVLSFRCEHPRDLDPQNKGEGPDSIFNIQGLPPRNMITIPLREQGLRTKSELRFLELSKQIRMMEDNPHFLHIAAQQATIYEKQKLIQEKLKEQEELTKRCEEVDKDYYRAITYLLLDAVQQVSGLVALGSVMKRLTKILVVDDFDKRTLKELSSKGFSRSNLTTMKISKLNKLYKSFNEFQKKDNPKQTLSFPQFVATCPYFEDFEVVLLNSWNLHKNKLPVQMRLKQQQVLSRKESRSQSKTPAQQKMELEKMKSNYTLWREDLGQTEEELKIAETRGGISESKYQLLEKKRKRLTVRLKKLADDIKAFQNPTAQHTKLLMYTADLVSIYKNYESMMRTMENKGDSSSRMDFFSFGKKDKSLDLESLEVLHSLFKQRALNERTIMTNNHEAKKTLMQMAAYSKAHPLGSNIRYEQAIASHIFRVLEISILSTGIYNFNELLHEYQGNYFKVEKLNAKWQLEWLNEIRIEFTTKNINTDTSTLRKMLQLPQSEGSSPVEVVSDLPTSEDFSNQLFNVLIINTLSYTTKQIVSCLRERNHSRHPHIPVLLLIQERNPPDRITRLKYRLLIGCKKNEKGLLTLDSPTCFISSIQDKEQLIPVFEEVIGIPQSVFHGDNPDLKKTPSSILAPRASHTVEFYDMNTKDSENIEKEKDRYSWEPDFDSKKKKEEEIDSFEFKDDDDETLIADIDLEFSGEILDDITPSPGSSEGVQAVPVTPTPEKVEEEFDEDELDASIDEILEEAVEEVIEEVTEEEIKGIYANPFLF